MHQVFILSHMGLRLRTRCYSRFLWYPAYEGVACFVLWNWMHVNMNTIMLRLNPARGSARNVCLVANAWYGCSTRSDMRSEFGASPREAFRQEAASVVSFRTRGKDPRVTRVVLRQTAASFAKRRIRGPDPRVRPAGQPKATRGSW